MAESISSPSSLKKVLSCDKKALGSNDPLPAEILGADEFSNFHIRICDTKISELYQSLRTAAQNAVSGKKCMTKEELEVGSPCIVEYCESRAGGSYFCRGKILEVFPDTDISIVRCFLIDDFLEVKVPQTQIFNTNSDIRFPTFALKCQLDEMECFMGQPLLKTFYDEFMKGEEKPHYCTVKIIRWTWNIPIVQLITQDGTNLAHLFQEFLPNSSRLHYPQPDQPLPVKVLHCCKEGKIYFRLEKDNELYKIVKSRLAAFQRGRIKVDTKLRAPFFDYESEESWRDSFLDGPESIFILKERTTSYRVRILSENKDQTVRVYFVDLGWVDDVKEINLTPAYQVDENLCYIEPQCLSAKLLKTEQCSHDKPCDRKIFWGLLKRKPIYLVLKDYGTGKLTDRLKGKILPNVDLLIRSKRTHPDHLGHSLVETLETFHPDFFSCSHSSKETPDVSEHAQLPDSDFGQPFPTVNQATDEGTPVGVISKDSNVTNETEESKLKSDNLIDIVMDCLKRNVIV